MRILLAVLFMSPFFAGCAHRGHVYLTTTDSMETSMVVNFHTAAEPAPPVLYYDTQDRGADLGAYRQRATGRAHQIPGLPDGRWISHVEIGDLAPDTRYFFAFRGDSGKIIRRSFHTLPADATPVRFVAGGDMGAWFLTRALLRRAAATEPDFAVIGGDIAYENGRLSNAKKYDRWLGQWEKFMRRDDGSLIPMILGMGNHDTSGKFETREENAPFFYGYFAQGGDSHFARRVGKLAVLVVLDSGHTESWEAQAPFLRDSLEAAAELPWRFAFYHVPLYPSEGGFDEVGSREGRAHWLPHFDAFRLTAAFEHHDHTFKRSKPLRGGALAEDGTLYLGDGCFGVPPRRPRNADAWYIDKTSGTPHFWLVDLSDKEAAFKAINVHGEVFDQTAVRKSR